MDGYVAAGYGITVGAIALYAIWVFVRGRRLARTVGEDE